MVVYAFKIELNPIYLGLNTLRSQIPYTLCEINNQESIVFD